MHVAGALELAQRGWAVHPLRPGDKVPASPHGCRDATTDPVQIREWWRTARDANAGIATGQASGVWVLDIDGDAGRASLAELEAEHGPLPRTLTVRTARGFHLYWRVPEGVSVRNGAGIRDGLDVRGDGGYVVAPGSRHPSGALYEWAEPGADAVDAPAWLLELATRKAPPAPRPNRATVARGPTPAPSSAGARPVLRDALQQRTFNDAIARMRATRAPDPATGAGGDRNATLNREAHAMAACAVPRHIAEPALISEAVRVGLTEREARATFASGYERGLSAPRVRKPGRHGWIRETRVDGLPERRATSAVDVRPVDPPPPPESFDDVSEDFDDTIEDEAPDARGAHGERGDPVPQDSHAKRALPLSQRRKPSPEDWQDRLLRSKPTKEQAENGEEGSLRASGSNAMLIAAHDRRIASCLAYDDHARAAVVIAPPVWGEDPAGQAYPRPLENHDIAAARVWLQTEWHLDFSKEAMVDALEYSAFQCRYHPVRDYLDGLTWDGHPRLADWLGVTFGACGDLPRVFGERWMIAAVARVYQPGCQADSILVLEGKQGLGKSTAFRILGGEFFSDAYIDLASKDGDLLIQGVWIQELGELAGMGKGELNRIKGWITRRTDRFRAPYAALPSKFPRGAIMGASTNEGERGYLRDETGNRRFWPVRCVCKLNPETLRQKRDQLWAEAVVRYREGRPWHLDTPELLRAAEAATSERMEIDPWEEALAGRVEGRDEMTTGEAFLMLSIPPDRRTRTDEMRLGAVLVRLGFTERRQVRREGRRVWGFFRST